MYIYSIIYVYIAMWPQNEMNESILSLNTVVDSLIIHCYIYKVYHHYKIISKFTSLLYILQNNL